jgi:hypothetical protein
MKNTLNKNILGKSFLKTLATALALPAATTAFAAPEPAAAPKTPPPATASAANAPTPAPADDEAVVLADVQVEGDSVSGTVLETRPSRSLYGFGELLRDTPRSVFQISAAQLDNDNIRNFTDFSRYSPSIRRGTTTTYSVANLRGSTADTARNGTILFNPALRPFDNNAWESVDIVAGSPSVSQGSTARTSGYVNYITKKPFWDGSHTKITTQFGRLGADTPTSYGQYSVQLDHSIVLLKDELAARVSLQRSEANQYWGNSAADFKDAYGAITWKPAKNLTIDANVTYLASEGAIPWGINRIDQNLIDNWTYRSGEYVPRITWRGSSYTYNPSLGGYTKNNTAAGSIEFPLGSEPWTQDEPGRLGFAAPPDGFVEKPIEGHQVVEGATEHNNKATEFIAQTITTLQLNEHFSLVNRTTYQYISNRNHNYDFMYSEHPNRLFETRFEFLSDNEFKIAGVPVRHQSNTGLAYRYLLNICDAAVSNLHSSNISSYTDALDPRGADLAWKVSSPVYTVSIYDVVGVQPVNPGVNDRGVLQTGYGWVDWEPSWFDGDTYRSLGVSTYANWSDRRRNYLQYYSAFSDHKFDIGKNFTWRIAGRLSYINDFVEHTFLTKQYFKDGYYPNVNRNDSEEKWNGQFNTSLSYHPVSWLNLYATYDRTESITGCGCCEAAGWSSGYRLDPSRFDVPSELFEIGAKFDIIPNKLNTSIAWFRQTRSNPSTDFNTGAIVSYDNLYQGAEFAVTWQATARALVGGNYSYIHTTNQRSHARFTGSPLHTLNLWASYQLTNGFGVKASFWLTSDWNVSNTVTVPAQYNVDLGLFYAYKGWRVDVDIMNVTDEKNWAPSGALGGNTYSYLLPLERLGAQVKVSYAF